MRTFQYDDEKSHKFWRIEVSGDRLTVTFGKVGASGQTQIKAFASDEKAQAEADRRIAEKLNKGYRETTPAAAPQPDTFELALAADPHDLATRCAYADFLAERGDPRGEFMQVQIALEDESRPAAERTKLLAREKELLDRHERDWLGILAPHLLDQAPNHSARPDWDPASPSRPGAEHRWRRGALAELTVDCLTVSLAQALADTPAVRFLEKLHVRSTAYYLSMQDDATPRRVPGPQQYRGYDEWLELLGAPLLGSLRVFQMGDIDGEPPEDGWSDNHTYAPGIDRLIAEMTRVEELHLLCKEYDSASLFALPNLTNLRVLRMVALGDPNSSGSTYEIRLDVLARNPALGKLTHLLLHPHFADDQSFIPLPRVAPVLWSPHLKSLTHLQLRLSSMGDEGAREIVASGILKRLKVLDLRHGCITDEGARVLAECPDARNLQCLDLSRNHVSPTTLGALRQAGVQAVANSPLTEQELADQEYLHEGDFE
jgi:uncharacterized protein (TIGR02996 family)